MTSRSIHIRTKATETHICLQQPEKSSLSEYSLPTKHLIQFEDIRDMGKSPIYLTYKNKEIS